MRNALNNALAEDNSGSEEQRSRTRCTHLRTGWARGRSCISIERLYKTYRCVHGPWVPVRINSSTGRGLTVVDKMTSSSVIIGKPVGGRVIRATRIESLPPNSEYQLFATRMFSSDPSDLWLYRETRAIWSSLSSNKKKKYRIFELRLEKQVLKIRFWKIIIEILSIIEF